MPHSYAETLTVTCAACGRDFDTEFWLVVDTAERPDLLAHIRAGTLHDLACPRCGKAGHMDTPLLLFQPDGDPILLFLPAEGTTTDEDRKQATQLVELLQGSLDDDWQNDWLAEGRLRSVPRALLFTLLSDDPEGDMAQMAAQAALQVPPELMEIFAELAASGVELRSLEDLEAALVSRPDLRARLETAAHAMDDSWPDITTEAVQEFERLVSVQQRAEGAPDLLPIVTAGWEMFIKRADVDDLPVVQARAGRNLALAFLRHYELTGDETSLTGACVLFEDLLRKSEWLGHSEKAAVQLDLGDIYSIRYEISRDDVSAQRADEHYKKALDEYRSADPPYWAVVMHKLGQIHARRYEYFGIDAHAEVADRYFRAALRVFRRKVAPEFWRSIQHSRGNIYARRYEHTGNSAYARRAHQYYHYALSVKSLNQAPTQLFALRHSLGNLYNCRYLCSGDDAHARRAIRHFARALDIAEKYSLPDTFSFRASIGLTHLWFCQKDWSKAVEVYTRASSALLHLCQALSNRSSKESWLREAQGLPANAAYALARLDRLEEAVVALEAGRARLLTEALEQNRRDLEQLDPLGHKAVLDRYRAASQRVTDLQQQASQSSTQSLRVSFQSPNHPITQFDYSTWRQQRKQARAELDTAIAAIRQVPGYEDFFLPPSFEKIQHAATPDAPLVYLATTPVGSVALVVRAPQTLRVSANHDSPEDDDTPANHDQTHRVSAVWLDDLTEADLRAAIYGPADGSALDGYLGAYDGRRRNPRSNTARDAWHAALDQTTRWLWDALMGRVLDHLARSPLPVTHATLVPTGLLALLPLHAAWTEDPSTPTGRRYALDAVTFRYAPSASALSQSLAGAARPANSLLAVDNPDGSLVFSRQEVEAVRSYFPAPQTTVLAGEGATRQAVLDQLPHLSIYHFSTHGWAGWRDPLASGLLLAGGPPLDPGRHPRPAPGWGAAGRAVSLRDRHPRHPTAR